MTMTTHLRSAPNDATRPTMEHVALLAGVSLKTVSRVVNGEAGVARATTERVQAALASVNFRRNDIARSLRYKMTTSSIGLVTEDLANPFYATLARAVGEVARRHGFLVLSGSSDESEEREREILTAFLGRRVDGLIVVPTGGSNAFLEREKAAGVQLVFVDRPGIGVSADTVLIDNTAGVLAGVRHLAHFGHRRIGVTSAMSRTSTRPWNGCAAISRQCTPSAWILTPIWFARDFTTLRLPRNRPYRCWAARTRRQRCSPATTSSRLAYCGRCAGAVATPSLWWGLTTSPSLIWSTPQ